MLFEELASYFQSIERTPSRNEMTEILAELFKKSAPEEIDKICYLSMGRLVPQYESLEFNIAEKLMVQIIARAYGTKPEAVEKTYGVVGDLGAVAEKLSGQKTKRKADRLITQRKITILLNPLPCML